METLNKLKLEIMQIGFKKWLTRANFNLVKMFKNKKMLKGFWTLEFLELKKMLTKFLNAFQKRRKRLGIL